MYPFATYTPTARGESAPGSVCSGLECHTDAISRRVLLAVHRGTSGASRAICSVPRARGTMAKDRGAEERGRPAGQDGGRRSSQAPDEPRAAAGTYLPHNVCSLSRQRGRLTDKGKPDLTLLLRTRPPSMRPSRLMALCPCPTPSYRQTSIPMGPVARRHLPRNLTKHRKDRCRPTSISRSTSMRSSAGPATLRGTAP